MLIRNADAAMYSAKERGRNNFQFYTAGLNEQAARRLAIEAGLRAALAEGTLELFYQPQAELASGRVLRAEALLRDSRGRLADVSPAEFVPVAEECGLIDRIGEWVLRAACQQARAWADAGLPLLPVAVNLSAAQFRRRDLAAIIADALAGESLPGEWLEIELTESLVMRDAEAAAEIFRQLKAMGVRLAIDDFGTGYSSLSYLKRFPIDRLKIDRSFVRDLPADRSSAELTRAIVAMAHALHLEV
ncbi:MAG: GGDEF domain-containing protein, partial [Lysobacterales bacterium]